MPCAKTATVAEPSSGARPLRIGVALGSGSARGWAHIGVLRSLAEAGIEPEVVCGTSIGALVGAAFASGQLDPLETWARAIKRLDVVRLMDVTSARGGVLAGARLFEQMRQSGYDRRIEDLDKAYAAVATNLETGREIWLREGSLLEAVRASISVPGLLAPYRRGDSWLVDGGLVNPVPVSVCHALGAEFVVAVNLNGDPRERTLLQRAERLSPNDASPRRVHRRAAKAARAERALRPPSPAEDDPGTRMSDRLRSLWHGTSSFLAARGTDAPRERPPGFFEVITGSIAIMQDRITRSRIAGDPPDVMVSPRLGHIRLLDYDRAEEIIAEGRAAIEPALARIRQLVEE